MTPTSMLRGRGQRGGPVPLPPSLEGRDLTLDLARVGCVLLVVVIHLLFVGVGADAAGGIAVSRPLEEQPWFWAATWAGQIMPLFFVVAGFASLTSLRGHARRGTDAATASRAFAVARMERLVRPAFPLFAFLTLALGGATVAGVDLALLDAVATGVGSPLWFLCAFLVSQLLAPVLLEQHDRAPRRTVLVLLGAVVLVDATRFATGWELVGYLNLLFVWPLIQQFGFWYADGWFARRRAWQLVAIALVCWLALVPMSVPAWGPYSLDMLTNLNPPTLPLVALGLGQAALLQLLKPPLTALMRARAARATVFVVGSRLMTVYLWHLPVIVAVAGLGLLVPGLAPAPGGEAWWASRPLALVVALALVFALSVPLAHLERPRPRASARVAEGTLAAPASPLTLATAAVLTIVPTFAITVRGLDVWLATAALLGYGLALVLLRSAQKPKSPPKSASMPQPLASAAPVSAPASAPPESADAGAS